MTTHRTKTALLLALLLVLAGGVRLLLWQEYPPASFPDSGTYVRAAQELVSGDFSQGQGRRTPGYPLVLALLGGSPSAVVAFQLLGGVVVSLLFYVLTLQLTGSRGWAVAAGLVHALNLQQLFQEGAILTEATAALAVVLALALLIRTCRALARSQAQRWAPAGIGVLAAYALFVRPQYICLVLIAPLALAWAAWRARRGVAGGLAVGALTLAPAVALVLAWCAIVQAKTGYFTMSTQSGFGMVNHPIEYIELASDEYAVVRDILVRVREQRKAEVGHSRNTIWYAWPEIREATGWSLPEASRQFQRMCKQLFIAYPGRYALSVASAWYDFWAVPILWEPERIEAHRWRGALEGIWWVEHKLLRGANLAFVLLVALVLVWPAARRRIGWDVALSAISATVLMSSLIQAMADQGASSRYHTPTQSLVVLVLVIAAARAVRPQPSASGSVSGA